VLRPWSAEALPEIMAVAVEEGKRGVPETFHEDRAAGQQPSSAAGARGGGATEARARPNVEVNRRAEGTSELNRRLGAVGKGTAALERCGAAGDYGWSLAGKQAQCAWRWADRGAAGQQLGSRESRAASRQPRRAAGDRGGGTGKPNRGLTLRLTGVPKARPS